MRPLLHDRGFFEFITNGCLAQMTPAGFEPAIPGSVCRCITHWATGPLGLLRARYQETVSIYCTASAILTDDQQAGVESTNTPVAGHERTLLHILTHTHTLLTSTDHRWPDGSMCDCTSWERAVFSGVLWLVYNSRARPCQSLGGWSGCMHVPAILCVYTSSQ